MGDHQEILRLYTRLGNWQNNSEENKGKPFVFSSKNSTCRARWTTLTEGEFTEYISIVYLSTKIYDGPWNYILNYNYK